MKMLSQKPAYQYTAGWWHTATLEGYAGAVEIDVQLPVIGTGYTTAAKKLTRRVMRLSVLLLSTNSFE